MRSFEFLIEYNRGPLIRQFGDKLVAKWMTTDNSDYDQRMTKDEEGKPTPDEILTWFERADPTKDSKYTPWLVQRFLKGERLEDISILKTGNLNKKAPNFKQEPNPTKRAEMEREYFKDMSTLEKYDKLSRKPDFPAEYNQIDRIRSLPDLAAIVSDQMRKLDTTELTAFQKNFQKGEEILKQGKDVRVLMDTSTHRVIIPQTFEMSKFFGRTLGGATWCTTSNPGYFRDYTDGKNDTPYYIAHKTGEPENWNWYAWFIKSTRPYEFRNKNNGLIWGNGDPSLDDFIKKHKEAVNPIITDFGGMDAVARAQPGLFFKYVKNPSEELKTAAVADNPIMITSMENPSDEMKLAAVKGKPDLISTIENPTDEMRLLAVKGKPELILNMKNPTEEMQMVAVTKNRMLMLKFDNPSIDVQNKAMVGANSKQLAQLIPNPTDEQKLTIVKAGGMALEYIKNPSEEVKLAAVSDDGGAVQFIDNPSEEIQFAAVSNRGAAVFHLDAPSDRTKMMAIKRNSRNIEYVKNPTEEMQMMAVKDDGLLLKQVENPSDRIIRVAVSQNGDAIEYIENPSDELKLLALSGNGFRISLIDNPTESEKLLAVRQSGRVLSVIDDPSEDVQVAAVTRTPKVIKMIDNPSQRVIDASQGKS